MERTHWQEVERMHLAYFWGPLRIVLTNGVIISVTGGDYAY